VFLEASLRALIGQKRGQTRQKTIADVGQWRRAVDIGSLLELGKALHALSDTSREGDLRLLARACKTERREIAIAPIHLCGVRLSPDKAQTGRPIRTQEKQSLYKTRSLPDGNPVLGRHGGKKRLA
jgi:hypothetical protein